MRPLNRLPKRYCCAFMKKSLFLSINALVKFNKNKDNVKKQGIKHANGMGDVSNEKIERFFVLFYPICQLVNRNINVS